MTIDPPSLSPSSSPFFSSDNFAFKSTLHLSNAPNHVAIIMDGNRRWARERQLPAAEGHAQGLERAIETVQWLRETPIENLTLFAFASANWRRSQQEVAQLFRLAGTALRRLLPLCGDGAARVRVIGRRDRLPAALRAAIEQLERETAHGTRTIHLALDYDARAAIADAIRSVGANVNVERITAALQTGSGTPPVDLLIRTGGEQRLSNFLLWECADAELYFSDVRWPDFTTDHLHKAINTYAARERRFGA